MNRTLKLTAALAVLAIAPFAHADAYDCFPGCPEIAVDARPDAVVDLCKVEAVREAMRINDQLKPAKELYDIAVNPTGFAVKMVDRHVVHIPKWVGIAMDPKGAVKAEVMKRARAELKKQVGLQSECRAGGIDAPAAADGDGDESNPES